MIMSTDAKAIEKLVAAFLDYERDLKKSLSLEEIEKMVEAERVKAEKEQGTAATTPIPIRR
jgi:hypothetical protein